MALIERTLDSGLILQEYGMDGAAIERELKKRDPMLSLQGWPSQTHGCTIWKVVREAADRPPETVCVWQSDRGEPFPLSSGILDLVDRLDRNSRHVHVGEDELNARHEAERRKAHEAESEAIREYHVRRHGQPVLPRSQSLRMARDKRRSKGEKC